MFDNGHESRELINRIERRLATLYGDGAARDCLDRLLLIFNRYDTLRAAAIDGPLWTEADNILITYGDMVRSAKEPPLQTLRRFLQHHLEGVIDTVHILPFFPYSSDDGFSVIDYRTVDPKLGSWDEIAGLNQDFRLMFDLVLNHCSRQSPWFRDYVAGVAPHRYYFHEVAPGTDLSQVVRPRSSPLLTQVQTRHGERWVWTTFSADQIDLNFANPDVLLEFVDIMLLHAQMGARIIRLDAIAYLWKELGTSCIHLPQTHEVVKLLRDILELNAPHVLLLTETNVPHEQNISYFGDGDEAHVVYNFSLPPLLLHALQADTAVHLTRWASQLSTPPTHCTYLNFTASHDGIGVRPLEGILDNSEISRLCDLTRQLGGHVSEKTNPDGSTSPYELNITWYEAMGRPNAEDGELQLARLLCSQAVMLALRGIPGLYFQALVAAGNDHEGVKRLGHARAINRHKWNEPQLDTLLTDPSTRHARAFNGMRRMLKLRARQPAFHPDAPQKILDLGDAIFVIQRTPRNGKRPLVALNNMTAEPQHVELRLPEGQRSPRWRDLLTDNGDEKLPPHAIPLAPYQVRWLTPSG